MTNEGARERGNENGKMGKCERVKGRRDEDVKMRRGEGVKG